MALSATIYKFDVDLNDFDQNVFQHWPLQLAKHPSETSERMATRLFAFLLNAHERLAFTKGLSEDSEPDLWQKSYTDEIELWIELGLPDTKRIKKAVSLSQQVKLFVQGGQAVSQWWDSVRKDCMKYRQLGVFQFNQQAIKSFAAQIDRTMRLSVMIQDGGISVSWADRMLDIPLEVIYDPGA